MFILELSLSDQLVLGHRGMVGSTLVRCLTKKDFEVEFVDRNLDLRDPFVTTQIFSRKRYKCVYLCAAKVGGIVANRDDPLSFLTDNLKIQLSVFESAIKCGVERVIFLGSSCIYPKLCPQPIKPQALLTGALETSNEAYALAKITGLKFCKYANEAKDCETFFQGVMPSNLYGIGDRYDDQLSHVIPGLIQRFHRAMERKEDHVVIWGDGSALREFMYTDDLAEAIVTIARIDREKFARVSESEYFVNVGSGSEVTIFELATKIKDVVGFSGELVFDETKPNGTPRKVMDSSPMRELGWKPNVSLDRGLSLAYEDYLRRIR